MGVEKNLESIINEFQVDGTVISAGPFGSGHINDTYLVRTAEASCPDYILQRINHNIFKNIPALMYNLLQVTTHIRKKLSGIPGHDPDRETLNLVPTVGGDPFFKDETGNYWRMFLFIKDTTIYQRITKPRLAYESGKAIGLFQSLLSDLPGLKETLPRFHSINMRLEEYHKALTSDHKTRLDQATDEIAFINSRVGMMQAYFAALNSGEIPQRVTHNDTKVNNILFDAEDHALCLIDMDTVMPGYVHFDFGDALRTLASTADEDEEELSKVGFDTGLFESFTKGYLETAIHFLSQKEIGLLPFSPLYLTFLIGLRFLTDHLNGDIYYKVQKPGHNLIRARAQFHLMKRMEENYESIEKIIERYALSA